MKETGGSVSLASNMVTDAITTLNQNKKSTPQSMSTEKQEIDPGKAMLQ